MGAYRSLSVIFALSLLGLPTLPAHAASFYVQTFEPNSRLFQIDSDTGGSVLIGQTGLDSLTDLALTPDGRLFASTMNQLYKLNRTTGAPTLVGAFGVSDVVGLDFTPDGSLYAVGQHGSLYSINPATATASSILTTPYSFVGDVAYFSGNTFYGTADFGGGSHLIEINASTLSAVDRGLIASGEGVPGLEFDLSGRLLAFCNSGEVLSIQNYSAAGAGVHLSNTGIAMAGATVVPEPASLWVVAIGGLSLAPRRLRARGT